MELWASRRSDGSQADANPDGNTELQGERITQHGAYGDFLSLQNSTDWVYLGFAAHRPAPRRSHTAGETGEHYLRIKDPA